MALRVTLVHNTEAGFNTVRKEELIEALQKKGYAVTYIDTEEDNTADGLSAPADFVMIAGGDGTLRKTGMQLLKKKVPIAVLPLGTANNIATSMGISGKPTDIIAALDINRKKAFDVGLLECGGEEVFFLESAGFGLLPRLIREDQKDKKNSKSREEELARARQNFVEMIKKHKATSCSILIDDQAYDGDFLMVQCMNIALTGPNVMFAPAADPGDGMLQVVLVREHERENFIQFVKNGPVTNTSADLPFIINGRNVTVEWEGWRYQADDEIYEEGPPVKAKISLRPHALEVLV